MKRNYMDITYNKTGSVLYTGGHPAEATGSIINKDTYFDNYSANLNYTHFFKTKPR
jgi:hypothetical protein